MKNYKVTLRRKGESTIGSEQEQAFEAELSHLIHGYRKKGDNLKTMVQKLNDHGHYQQDGRPWDYPSLQEAIRKLGL